MNFISDWRQSAFPGWLPIVPRYSFQFQKEYVGFNINGLSSYPTIKDKKINWKCKINHNCNSSYLLSNSGCILDSILASQGTKVYKYKKVDCRSTFELTLGNVIWNAVWALNSDLVTRWMPNISNCISNGDQYVHK